MNGPEIEETDAGKVGKMTDHTCYIMEKHLAKVSFVVT